MATVKQVIRDLVLIGSILFCLFIFIFCEFTPLNGSEDETENRYVKLK